MKIIRESKVYVQQRDLGLIFDKPLHVSYYIDSTKDLDFVEITDEEAKLKVQNAEYLLDYDSFLDKSIDEIERKQASINSIIISLSMQSRMASNEKALKKLDLECKKLINSSNELHSLLLAREGKISFDGHVKMIRKKRFL